MVPFIDTYVSTKTFYCLDFATIRLEVVRNKNYDKDLGVKDKEKEGMVVHQDLRHRPTDGYSSTVR